MIELSRKPLQPILDKNKSLFEYFQSVIPNKSNQIFHRKFEFENDSIFVFESKTIELHHKRPDLHIFLKNSVIAFLLCLKRVQNTKNLKINKYLVSFILDLCGFENKEILKYTFFKTNKISFRTFIKGIDLNFLFYLYIIFIYILFLFYILFYFYSFYFIFLFLFF